MVSVQRVLCMPQQPRWQRRTNVKKPSEVFKNIRFAKLQKFDKPHKSTDEEEHGAVGEVEWNQQLAHQKKRSMQEDLRKWFDPKDPEGGWKRINSKGEAIGPCAREPGEAKPKCMSNEKRASLSKKERAAAVRAKRKHDPNPERKGEPINVSNFGKGKLSESMEQLDEKNVPTNPELWARAKSMAKSKFDVYPSAYANGWASKWYKSKGGGWKSVSEEVDGKTEVEKNIEKTKKTFPNVKHFTKSGHPDWKKHGFKDMPVKEEVDNKDKGEYDYEGDMVKSDLRSVIANAQRIHDMLKDDSNLPEWCQSKVTLAEDYISTVANYLTSEMNEETQINELSGETKAAYTLKAKQQVQELQPHAKKGEYKDLAKNLIKKREKGIEMAKEEVDVKDVPFEGGRKAKGTVTDKSGAKHSPMSRVRDIARKAMEKQMPKAKKPEPSNKTKVVKETMKDAKNKDKFVPNPQMTGEINR